MIRYYHPPHCATTTATRHFLAVPLPHHLRNQHMADPHLRLLPSWKECGENHHLIFKGPIAYLDLVHLTLQRSKTIHTSKNTTTRYRCKVFWTRRLILMMTTTCMTQSRATHLHLLEIVDMAPDVKIEEDRRPSNCPQQKLQRRLMAIRFKIYLKLYLLL